MKKTDQQKWLKQILKSEKVFTKMPSGWRHCHGSSAPIGYLWINNGKSLFGGQYEHALLKVSPS